MTPDQFKAIHKHTKEQAMGNQTKIPEWSAEEWAQFNKKAIAGITNAIYDCLGEKSLDSIRVASLGIAFAHTTLANGTDLSPKARAAILDEMMRSIAQV